MLESLNPYGNLITTMTLGAVLGLSVYVPLTAGQLSLASPGFYALGGYVAAIGSTRVFTTDGAYPLVLVGVELAVSAVLCAAVAAAVGLCALRLSGIYLAMATIAFVEVLRVVSLNLDVTGRAIGIFGIPQPFSTKLSYLWLALPLLVGAAWFTRRLERVRAGRSFAAIREDELAASAMGIDATRAKVSAFVVGGVMAGLAGVIAAHLLNTWNTRQGTFDTSIAYLSFVLIGGSRTWLGPIVGGMALTYLPEWLREQSDAGVLPGWLSEFSGGAGRLVIYGAALATSCVLFPQGFVTPRLMARVGSLVRRRRRAAAA